MYAVELIAFPKRMADHTNAAYYDIQIVSRTC